MAEDDRAIRSRLGDEALKAARAADPVTRQEPDTLGDVRHGGGDRVVVVRLDPEGTRRFRRPEPGGMRQSERDRDLPEDVTGLPLADHALDAVDELDRLDPTLEQPEERRLVSLVNRELTGAEADIGRDPTEPLAIRRLEALEYCDPTDVVRRQHWENASAGVLGPMLLTLRPKT